MTIKESYKIAAVEFLLVFWDYNPKTSTDLYWGQD